MEQLASQITTVDRLILYIIAVLATVVIGMLGKIVYDAWSKRHDKKELHDKIDKLLVDNTAMKHFIKDKGIYDFKWDCRTWAHKGYITPDAKADLINCYNDLEALGANGERKVGKEMIDALQVKEEI